MDYEKLHKETLNTLQQMVSDGKITENVAKGICSDFVSESNDKRIIREILETLRYGLAFEESVLMPGATTTLKEAIAYLEKQKEHTNIELQKAFEKSKIDFALEEKKQASDYAESILPTSVAYGENENEYKLHKIIEAAYIAGQKEQKPAEYEKPLLSKFEQAIYDCAWGKVTCKPEGETQEEYAKRWAEHLLLMVRDWADDYIDSQIESAKRKAYDKGKADAEQLAEWSEKNKTNGWTGVDLKRYLSCLQRLGTGNSQQPETINSKWFKEHCHPQQRQAWNEEDEKHINWVIEHFRQSGELYHDLIDWLTQLTKRLNLQSNQGWSEEDKVMLNNIIRIIHMKSIMPLDEMDDRSKYKKYEDFLKSLPERFNLQPKQEWSEEDEGMYELFSFVIELVENCPDKEKVKNWIKEIKGRFINSDYRSVGLHYILKNNSKSWKPSEEQMKCLEDCVNRAREIYNASTSGYNAYHTLSSLYQNLQKLV